MIFSYCLVTGICGFVGNVSMNAISELSSNFRAAPGLSPFSNEEIRCKVQDCCQGAGESLSPLSVLRIPGA
ncbi:hypothetical protein H5410_017255 [Solanum commersonii]|uniref:Uncharacterized protein n=1 Tax=Solanum commersonii TaxID=4109 RepID=A0A9J6A001_SOLCO|nr:hypothetical protein H5410_017255 [Solanum commersonii]